MAEDAFYGDIGGGLRSDGSCGATAAIMKAEAKSDAWRPAIDLVLVSMHWLGHSPRSHNPG